MHKMEAEMISEKKSNMKLGNIFFIAVAAGAVWALVLKVIVTIVAMLVSGEAFVPQLTASFFAGGIATAAYMLCPLEIRKPKGLLLAGLVYLATLALFALGQPLGTSIAVSPIHQVLALGIATGLTLLSWHMCFNDFTPASKRRYQVEVLALRVVKGLGFVFFTLIVALPFYVMLMTSFKSQQSLLSNPLDLSIDFAQGFESLFRSYIELFSTYHFGTFLLNSALVSVATVVITLLFSVPGAYAVARLRFPGQAVLSRSILLIYMVPAIVLVIPLYAVFSQLGLRNTLIGLLFVYPATTIPVAVYMLQGYFRGLPSELEDAGLMDGLSRLGVIMKVTLPLSLPALASVSLYVFMIAWNEFLFAFMFLDDVDLFTLSRGVMSLNSSEVPRQHLMAGAVVATVPVLAVFLWFEKFLVAGLTSGSVKG